MEVVDAEILDPLEVRFSDLKLLSSSSSRASSSLSSAELERLESISRAIMETLGPSGPGFLTISGVPKASELRRILLPLARKLALLSNDDRRRILKDHNLGSDVPLKNLNRTVSSFALQLRYVGDPTSEHTLSEKNYTNQESHFSEEENPIGGKSIFEDNEFKNLGSIFKELGFCMMELGFHLARVCDKAIGSQELEESLLESCSAKGRLIHYHSTLDNFLLKEAGRKRSTKLSAKCQFQSPCGSIDSGSCGRNKKNSVEFSKSERNVDQDQSCRTSLSDLWQQWHYDYGIFTVLTAPMFISAWHPPTTEAKDGVCVETQQECLPPDGHTYLQIFDPNKNSLLVVRSSPENIIIQVGESADILSKGKLRSALHSVCRPIQQENISRETFVVFMQPSWSKTFSGFSRENVTVHSNCSGSYDEKIHLAKQEEHQLIQEIQKIVPPLSSRFKDGMTFAEFSRETTKQYYGGSGLQSNR
ncbi:PREDICTED: uncharacterized protein LOC104598657 [Nelumbo nucifera]|uniref:Uncharacterized protein LOC104598657 n=1 Tax=Nelumbo nucifera TaxID=4432 RepID=A0A1U8AAP5_NELNU|nr:PREDICTED: uncharacterized protein LOC104598657 [Nelumbo nucifera]